MKPNDLVTWAGRNGETRHGKVTALQGIYARVGGGVLMRRNPVILRCVGIN